MEEQINMKKKSIFILAITLVIISFFIISRKQNVKTSLVIAPQKPATFKHAIAVTPHIQASNIAKEIMKGGGNVFDATVAAGFALAVIHPQACDLGGGGFAVYRLADGTLGSLDFREKAPQKAHAGMFLDENRNVIKGLSTQGGLAVGVPGMVDGMIKLNHKLGKIPLRLLMQPAITLARQGFAISAPMAKLLNRFQKAFKKANKESNPFIKDTKWQQGDVIVRPNLARTLQRIADLGRAGFYSGKTARSLVSSITKHKGIINYQDLIKYKSVWRNPIVSEYKDYQLISMSLPSSGGICLTQILKAAEPYDLKTYGFQSSHSIALLTEAMRRSFADRTQFLGDSDFVKIPLSTLLSPQYIQKRMADFSFTNATKSSQISHGKIDKALFEESFETAHYSIVDQKGNAVSITVTLNSNFGSKIYVEKAGIFLNNEMDDFSKKTKTPNQFGLFGTTANEVRPGKRMLSSMTPTIITKNDKLFMLLGSPGGPTIITNVAQTFLNVAEYGMNIQQAVDAPRFHHQYLPDVIKHEPNAISANVRKRLKKLGYKLQSFNRRIGQTNAIMVTKQGLQAGVDSRGEKENGADGF